jgi:hypothetical protein
VEQLVLDRIHLVFLHEDARVGAVELQVDERVHARFRVQNAHQRLGIHRDRCALSPAAVEDRRDESLRAQPPRLILAERFTLLCFEYCFHVSVFFI